MFDYMIEDNKLMPYFQKEFKDNVTEDIAFIKELMTGIKGEQAVCSYINVMNEMLILASETKKG